MLNKHLIPYTNTVNESLKTRQNRGGTGVGVRAQGVMLPAVKGIQWMCVKI